MIIKIGIQQYLIKNTSQNYSEYLKIRSFGEVIICLRIFILPHVGLYGIRCRNLVVQLLKWHGLLFQVLQKHLDLAEYKHMQIRIKYTQPKSLSCSTNGY